MHKLTAAVATLALCLQGQLCLNQLPTGPCRTTPRIPFWPESALQRWFSGVVPQLVCAGGLPNVSRWENNDVWVRTLRRNERRLEPQGGSDITDVYFTTAMVFGRGAPTATDPDFYSSAAPTVRPTPTLANPRQGNGSGRLQVCSSMPAARWTWFPRQRLVPLSGCTLRSDILAMPLTTRLTAKRGVERFRLYRGLHGGHWLYPDPAISELPATWA
jgi:hypothetical protein